MPNPPAPTPYLNATEPYKLESEELQFYQTQTGIKDEVELKNHILDVQERAYKIFPYPCIRQLGFLKCRVAKYPYYEQVRKLLAERPDAIYLDLGCCIGGDIRKIIADGWPQQNVVVSDLRPEFWEIGHKLFNGDDKSFPIPFVAGDIFSDSTFDPSASPLSSTPALNQSLTSLTPLKGHISVIHVSAFFHLFGEAAQLDLARRLAALLSPEPGSIMFGSQVGALDNQENGDLLFMGQEKYRHSPQSWKRLWDEVGNFEVFSFNLPQEMRLSGKEAKMIGGWHPDIIHHTRLVWMVRRL